MTFTKETHEQAEVIKVTASLFFDSVQEFDALMQDAEDVGQSRVIVDLSGAEMVCSSAITTLVKHHRSLKEKGRELVVSGCNSGVQKVMSLLGLEKIVLITDSLEEALDFVAK